MLTSMPFSSERELCRPDQKNHQISSQKRSKFDRVYIISGMDAVQLDLALDRCCLTQ
jgi:hypothetical protein